MRCWFGWRWTHKLSWPIRHEQTCMECGIKFPAKVYLGPVVDTADVVWGESNNAPTILDLGESVVVWPFEGTDGI